MEGIIDDSKNYFWINFNSFDVSSYGIWCWIYNISDSSKTVVDFDRNRYNIKSNH